MRCFVQRLHAVGRMSKQLNRRPCRVLCHVCISFSHPGYRFY